MEVYATGNIEKDAYILKNLDYDNEINKLEADRQDLAQRIPLLHKTDVINASVAQFCQSGKVQLSKCTDFDSKRKFLLDHVSKVIFNMNTFSVHGFVPILLKEYEGKNESVETGKIEFCIKGEVPRFELVGRKYRKPDFSKPITRKEYDLILPRNH